MKINYLKINGFGKLKEKEIELDENVNLIYGDNETGKSTMLKFIISMLYGASKNKNGKEISIYDKYKPWDNTEFSGKLKYTLDNNETFEIYREFNKKNPKIYDKKLEEITSSFNNDKTKGINFLYEQTKVDEDLFLSTSIVDQEGVKLSKSEQNNIIQKISNAVSTRDDNISYKKSLDKINKRLNTEVGTDRTSERPINIVNEEIAYLNSQKALYEEYKIKKSNIESEKNDIIREIENKENRNQLLKKIKSIAEKNKINYAEIDLHKNIENDLKKKIDELNMAIYKLKQEESEKIKKSDNKFIILTIISIILLIIFTLCKLSNTIKLFSVFTTILFVFLAIYVKIKERNSEKLQKMRTKEDIKSLQKEIDIIESNQSNKLEEQRKLEEKLLVEKNQDKNLIIEEFSSIISSDEINDLLNLDYNQISSKVQIDNEYLNELKIQKNTLEIELKNINQKLEELSYIEEKINFLNKQKDELNSLAKSINLAKECLENAYKQMKENINPEFIRNLSKAIEKMSNGKYRNVNFNDIDGLQVELKNGDYISADMLSYGTICQMYLALRINILEEITSENMPIILDESFVYFDEERLSNAIKFITGNYSNQLIIFSCSKREKEILDNLNINYKLVEM